VKSKKIKLIAEIANAHQGSDDEAIRLFQSFKEAGATAIKFQIYNAEELMVKSHSRFEHFKKQAFSYEEWEKIFKEIDRTNIEVYADIFGLESLEYATTKNLDGIKIHSSDLGNHDVLTSIKNYKGRVFVSAGGSTAPEIIQFVNPIIKSANAKEIILMHGFQTYPTPVEDSNLKKFNFFKGIFEDKVSYGYMDHIDADSELASHVPFALLFNGIDYIEKHVTHDRSKKGTDYYSSYEPNEFFAFSQSIQKIESSYGEEDSFFSNAEKQYRTQAKKVYVYSRDLNEGTVITANDIVMKRTDTQVPSLAYDELIGRVLLKSVKKEDQALKTHLNLKVLAVVVVRTGSTRLPRKALKPVAGEESIVHLLKRLDVSKNREILDNIIICTSLSSSDDELAAMIKSLGHEVYRGSEENVLNRMILGINDHPDYEIILRITGDDILIDPDYLKKTIENHKENNSDYTDAKNLPSGTEVEVFSRKVLEFINDYSEDSSGSEYLTNYFKDIEEHFRSSSLEVDEDYKNIRLTLDTKEDYELISSLIDAMEEKGKKYEYTLNDIKQFFEDNPKKADLNSNIEQRAIPSRFNTKIDWKRYSHDPLISVYITCYNYEKFVEEAIDSVLSQNFSDFELIIIDDGSSDKSRDRINKYRYHPKVKIIFQNNLGLNKTNNVAINLAKGKFIMRLDADDYLDSNALHLMSKKLLEDDTLALVFPDYILVDPHGELIAQEIRHNFAEVGMMDQPAHGACTMFRKSILEEVGNYSEEYDCQDGYEIWTKIAENYPVSNINLPLFYYRQHPESLTRDEERILSTRSKILSTNSGLSDSCNILAIVPVRKVSSSLALHPFKSSNLLDITLEKLKGSKRIKEVIVSSNDELVREFCKTNNYKFHERKDILSEWNSPIEGTIDSILETTDCSSISYISIINFEYPFMDIRNVENSIDVLNIYNANSSMSVIASESNYFNHSGNGLVPLSRNSKLRLERDKIFEETGGIHSVELSWYIKNRKLHSEKISHLMIERQASRKAIDLDDLKMFEAVLKT
tara:strand:- start:16262 stop:19360 length:3099 start_codon:yes stop_codon:yes gene_type:complete